LERCRYRQREGERGREVWEAGPKEPAFASYAFMGPQLPIPGPKFLPFLFLFLNSCPSPTPTPTPTPTPISISFSFSFSFFSKTKKKLKYWFMWLI
jgi:hypothetical protein